MAASNRVDIAQRIYAKVEATEGTEPAMTATEAFLCDKLASNVGTMPQAFLQRIFAGTMGAYTGKMGAIEKTKLAYSIELRGNGASSLTPEYDAILTAVLPTIYANTISQPATGGTTTVPTCATCSLAVSPANSPIMVASSASGLVFEMGWVKSVITNTSITLAQTLTTAPLNTWLLRPGRSYGPGDSGHTSITHQIFLDSGAVGASSDYVSFRGCKGSLKIDVPKVGAIPKLTFDWTAIDWLLHLAGTKLALTVNTTAPPVAIASIVKINGALQDIMSFSLDLGQSIGQKTSQNSTNGVFSEVVTQRLAKGTLKIYNTSANTPNNIATWQAGTEQELTLQFGNTLFNTVGIRIPKAQFTDVKYASDTGMLYDEIAFQCSITSGADEVFIGLG